MPNKLVFAGAGAGKSTIAVASALAPSDDSRKVLLVTYTESNQKELLSKFCNINTTKPSHIRIKGWFQFLLEDLVRPYQCCVVPRRIKNIVFNVSNPHQRRNRSIPGTAAEINGTFNPRHYLTSAEERAHTMFLSQLACAINAKTEGAVMRRIASVYRLIIIDEIQDLVGWDYVVLDALAASGVELLCVGDFRQTIYATTYTKKAPVSAEEKLAFFNARRFDVEALTANHRSVQPICDFADKIHSGVLDYGASESRVADIPAEFSEHVGVFTVDSEKVSDYLDKYNPVILRLDRSTRIDLCEGRTAMNFGESKGIGFARTLVLTTEKQRTFLAGDDTVFDKDETEKPRNTFYVVSSRARYSTAFLLDGLPAVDGISAWKG